MPEFAYGRNPMDDSELMPPDGGGIRPDMAVGLDPKDVLDMYLQIDNVAADRDEKELAEVAEYVLRGFDIDKDSRAQWEAKNKEALDLARQLEEVKKWGGEEVSNVKYPLIATACIQFQSRAYANVVKGQDYVRSKVTGPDPTGEKAARGSRLTTHMNWQLADKMTGWEDGMDQLLMSLPVIGCAFKKTYRDFVSNVNVSEYIGPENLVVHYNAKSIETAPRVSHILELTLNEYLERVRSGIWLDIELEKNQPDAPVDDAIEREQEYESFDDMAPYIFVEQHCWYDLDGDDYKEPWVITVHKDTRKVVRIMPRFDADGIIRNEKGKIVRIHAVHYFTQYSFFPAFDGSFYRMGFGILLSPINDTINTTINQLLDSGTLQNRQSGFINRGLRLTKAGASGTIRFAPGEWKMVQTPGDDIRKGIMPLPVHEPSATLFQLLGLMLEAGKYLASQSELLSGEQTQPNVPATTTLALIEQGLKVFSSIYKRVHRALKGEYKKLRRLNKLYTTPEEYNMVIDDEQPRSPQVDYSWEDSDIEPISNTADVSDTQKLLKAQALLDLRGQGLNDDEIMRRFLEALQIDNIDRLFPEAPPPNPQVEYMMAQLAMQHAAVQQKERELDLKEYELVIKDAEAYERMVKSRADAIKSLAQAEAEEIGPQLEQYQAMTERMGSLLEIQKERIARRFEMAKAVKEQKKANEEQQGADQQAGVPSLAGPPDNQGGDQGINPAAAPPMPSA
jgi:chaperonin GroES